MNRPAAPDLFDRLEALFATRRAQVLWFTLFALLTRATVFGQTNYFNDEYFYWQIGLRAHDGLLPYVDLWDRKGPGLFLIYWLIGFLSTSVLAYQLVACAFAGATAYVASRIAQHFTTRLGAVLGGTLYLVMTAFLGGAGGQSPVFYNLFIALAALAIVQSLPELRQGQMPRRLYWAMLSAGFALTFKQVAIFEAAFLGLFALWQLARGGMAPASLARTAALMALAGAAPFAAFGLAYALAGHFAEFWQAMITANLRKTYNPGGDHWTRIGALATLSAALWIPALLGLLTGRSEGKQGRGFLIAWLLASLAGLLAIPNFYEHYLLPLCLPFSVAAACAFGWRRLGNALGIFTLALMLLAGGSFDFARAAAAREAMASLTRDILARDPQPAPLVYEGPVDLYRQLGAYPPSPLYFPLHLYFPPEDNVSQFDTAETVRHILATRPSVVITFHDYPASEENQRTAHQVHAYTAAHCRLWFTRKVLEAHAEHDLDVWGDCRAQRSGGDITGR